MKVSVWLLTIVVASFLGQSLCQISPGMCPPNSNTGRAFYMAIPLSLYDHSSKTATLYIASNQDGRARLEYPDNHIFKIFAITKGETKYSISPSSTPSNGTGRHGFLLTSGVDISVSMFITSSEVYTGEILALPAPALGMNYSVPNAKPFDYSYPSSLIVVGTQDNTKITLQFPSRLHTSTQRKTLDTLQTYIISGVNDLSGIHVSSNKPVAVLSAVEAARVPSFHPGYYAEAIAQFLPPDNFGGKHFLVPNLMPGRREYSVRVMALQSGTHMTFQNSTRTTNFSLSIENTAEFGFGTDAVEIAADKPVMVYQYGVSSDNDASDNGAFLRNIPAKENFVTEAQFVAQGVDTSVDNVIQIIVPTGETVQLDGNSIVTLSSAQSNVYNMAGQSYTVYTKTVSPGYHKIEGGSVPFGAVILGHQSSSTNRAGYGNALAIRDPACSGTMPITLTTTPITSTTTPITSTTTPITSTTTPMPYTTSIPAVGENLCLSCEDVTHIYLCNVFVRCPSNQVCFVEQYKNFAHQTRYRMGCRDPSGCSRREREEPVVDLTTHINKRVSLCVECCHGNFCNTQGCGSEGLPQRQTRGPLCLSCAHVQSPDECNTLAYCQSEEVCYVGKSNLFGDVMNYSFGCENQQCRAVNHGKILCEQCCQDDFCNHACNMTTPGVLG